jgi:adenylate cyclase
LCDLVGAYWAFSSFANPGFFRVLQPKNPKNPAKGGFNAVIITELSRYTDLLVIARNSAFQYRDKSVDMKHVGRELGVEYLVEGSLRKAGDRIRIAVQLIAASTGSHLWAERYDRGLKDVFAVQDQVAQTIAATLVGRVAASGTESARRKPTELWAAYDCFLQAMECNNRYETDRAIVLLNRAIHIDPQYAQAYAMLAFVHVWKFYVDYKEETLNAALAHARTALSIDNNDGLSQMVMGLVQTHLRNWDIAGMHLANARSLNPNSRPVRGHICQLAAAGWSHAGSPRNTGRSP